MKILFEFTPEEVNKILAGLSHLPIRDALEMAQAIKQEAEIQIKHFEEKGKEVENVAD